MWGRNGRRDICRPVTLLSRPVDKSPQDGIGFSRRELYSGIAMRFGTAITRKELKKCISG